MATENPAFAGGGPDAVIAGGSGVNVEAALEGGTVSNGEGAAPCSPVMDKGKCNHDTPLFLLRAHSSAPLALWPTAPPPQCPSQPEASSDAASSSPTVGPSISAHRSWKDSIASMQPAEQRPLAPAPSAGSRGVRGPKCGSGGGFSSSCL